MRGVLSRGLSATVISTLESNAFQIAILVRLELNTNYHLGTAQQSIVYDSNTYTSSGVFLNLADIEEEAQFNTGQIKIRLGNASQTFTNDLITYAHIDKTVKIFTRRIAITREDFETGFGMDYWIEMCFKARIKGEDIKV